MFYFMINTNIGWKEFLKLTSTVTPFDIVFYIDSMACMRRQVLSLKLKGY